MPLDMIEVRELLPFLTGFLNNVVDRDATFGTRDKTLGWVWDNGFGWGRSGNWAEPGYYQAGDQLMYFSKLIIRTSLTQYNPAALIMDAQGIDVLGGRFRDNFPGASPIPQASNVGKYYMGQWQLESGSMRIYSFGSMSALGVGWFEYDPIALSYSSAPIHTDFDPETSVVGVGVNGRYTSQNYLSNTSGRIPMGMLFFEGMTDSASYPEITDGPSSTHPLGLALIRADLTLRLSGVDIGNAWAWVDVDTGNAVGFLDIPYDTRAEAFQQSEPNIDGEAFDWSRIDFYPDPDSLDAQPKGELHVYSAHDSVAPIPSSGTFLGGVAFDGFRIYVTAYDFNPYGLTTGKTRIHNRRSFLGAIDLPQEPSVPGGFDTTDANHPASSAVFFHQPSNSYFMWTGYGAINPSTDSAPEPAFYPEIDSVAILRWKRSFSPQDIVQSPIGSVTTNKTVRHQCIVYGDFSVRASGVALTATLARASTYEEQFTPAGATSVIVVEAAVIDDNSTLEVYEGTVSSGTLLAETTNYTVVHATGTITGVDFTPSVVHSLVYQHRSNELTPPHGTLLSASATSDEDGVATFDVKYANDATLEDMIDSLTITSD